MANICDTQYKVTGSPEAVKDLWNTLLTLEVNSKNVPLYRLAEHYGIDYEAKGISVRGNIYWADYEEDKAGEYSLLSFDTETAWAACDELFEEINRALGEELSISYREVECGCCIYNTHDEGDFFPEECCVSASGAPFDDMYEEPYETVGDAVNEWCEKMGIEREGRTDEEMTDFIHQYEYGTEDTYFYINLFIFV